MLGDSREFLSFLSRNAAKLAHLESFTLSVRKVAIIDVVIFF